MDASLAVVAELEKKARDNDTAVIVGAQSGSGGLVFAVCKEEPRVIQGVIHSKVGVILGMPGDLSYARLPYGYNTGATWGEVYRDEHCLKWREEGRQVTLDGNEATPLIVGPWPTSYLRGYDK